MPPRDSVNRLQQLMIDGGERAFDLVPMTLANVINERQWADQPDQDGNPFTSFEKFVTHKLWWGLESTIDDLRAFCRKRPDVVRLILAEVDQLPAHGGERKDASEQGDIVTLDRGNAATYTLKRLKRDAPELFQQVVDGHLSANAAAIEAGFRKKLTPFEQIEKLIPKLTDAERSELRAMLA